MDNPELANEIEVKIRAKIAEETIEIGYFIGEPYWGKGIATKAVESMLAYIEKQFDVVRIFAEVFEHNKASMRILRKNGFHLESIRQKAVIKDGVIMDDYVWVKLDDKK
jgi:ribosomal-protein-alanine N-acetyltransferase